MQQGRILVVDDELSMREFLEILLENLGYDVTIANGGTDAVARLNAAESPYDLVLTDLKMSQVDVITITNSYAHMNKVFVSITANFK